MGVLFVITYVTSIAAKFAFYPPLLGRRRTTSSAAGDDTQVLWGAFFEVILIVANIGTAVALFPVLKRQTKASPSASSPPGSWSPSSSPWASSAS